MDRVYVKGEDEMKELTHTGCGGELSITWVYATEMDRIVEFNCLKCKKDFSYEEGLMQ